MEFPHVIRELCYSFKYIKSFSLIKRNKSATRLRKTKRLALNISGLNPLNIRLSGMASPDTGIAARTVPLHLKQLFAYSFLVAY
jgi:hypothetical protein